MKKLLIVAFVLMFASVAYAGTNVSFRWDANTEPDLLGYRVLKGTASGGPYNDVSGLIECAPNDLSCCEYTEPNVPDGTYFWVAIAEDTEGFQSAYSVEQTAVLDTSPPGPPQNFNIWQKIIAWFKSMFKNFRIG